MFYIFHRLGFLLYMFLLAAVVSLRTNTHQGGSRIPHLPFFFFSAFDFVFSFFFYCPSLPVQFIRYTYERLYTHTDFLLCRSFSSSFFLSRYIYIMLIDDEHLLSYEISCFIITIKSNQQYARHCNKSNSEVRA